MRSEAALTLLGEPISADSGGGGGASVRGASRIMTVEKCEQAWKFRIIDKLRPRHKAEIPLIGSAFHQYRAFYWARKIVGWGAYADLQWAHQEPDKAVEDLCRGYPETFRLAKSMFSLYPTWAEHMLWEPVSVEKEYRVPLQSLFQESIGDVLGTEVISSRLDSVFRAPGGLIIVDCKTKVAGREGSGLPPWRESNHFGNLQAALNLHILRAVFDEPVLGFVHERVTQTATPEIDVHPVLIPAKLYDEVPYLVKSAIARELLLADRPESARRTGIVTGACRFCDYQSVCADESNKGFYEIGE